jgi:hypothetical protein
MRLHRLFDAVFITSRVMGAERNALHRVNSALAVFCACTEDMQERRCAKICRDGICGIVTNAMRAGFTRAAVRDACARGSKARHDGIGGGVNTVWSGLRLLRQLRVQTAEFGSRMGTGSGPKRLPPWRKILIFP